MLQFIKWLSNLRKKYGKVYRVFTGNRAYVVLMDKVVGPPTFLTKKDPAIFSMCMMTIAEVRLVSSSHEKTDLLSKDGYLSISQNMHPF